jgi:2-methylisocitrate lyase-like PEP mutase family enzyme
MPSIAEKRADFRKLHESGCFVIPNPWDIGSARYLVHLGFKAVASTSAGFAFSRGLADNAVPRDAVLEHLAELVAAVDVPVNADFENGFAHDPEGVANSVGLCAETGVAGLSIEDSTGDANVPLYELTHAVARIRAAREALDVVAPDTMLVARAEGFLVGRPDLDDVIARLRAFASAGAD